MNIAEVLKYYYVERFELEILLSEVLNISRASIVAHPEYELSLLEQEKFYNYVNRRLQGEPIAYILNRKEFWSLPFYVDKSTLIPRPETELLIEIMLETFKIEDKLHFLDLGTGSGVIAITLAKLFPNSMVIGVDCSEAALDVAKKNQLKHDVYNVSWVKSDWFSEIQGFKYATDKFDAILSNPPYLSENDPHLLKGDVRFEPRHALSGGRKGIEQISKIASESKKYLKENLSFLLIEHGYDQELAAREIFIENNFEDIVQKKDFSGLPRVTIGKLSGIKRVG